MPAQPEIIGRYRVVRLLGSGGMGAVYLAEDPLLKRSVAVKIVRGSSGSDELDQVLARFQRESEISAQLSHPNIITIFDVGEHPGVGPFLAMEYVDGASLATVIRDDVMQIEAKLRVLIEVAAALETAHAAGIVHRDVKPQNVMVGRDGRSRLMDFGIARSHDSTLTATGAVLGTPAYIAPEQLNGVEPSEATDAYAFAVLAFELVCRQLPYPGKTMSAILYRIAHEAPTMPDDVSPNLRAVFERALAKQPESRFTSLAPFVAALIDACPLEPAARNRLRAALENTPALARRLTEDADAPEPEEATVIHAAPPARETALPAPPPAATAVFASSTLRWAMITLGVAIGIAGGAFAWFRSMPRVLSVSSTPSGAAVFVDETRIGETPLVRAAIPRDGRNVRLELADHEPVERPLGADEAELAIRLAPLSFPVTVRTSPSGADVFVDGQAVGKTPVENLALSTRGSHVLRLAKPGYEEVQLDLSRDTRLPDPIALAKIEPEEPPTAEDETGTATRAAPDGTPRRGKADASEAVAERKSEGREREAKRGRAEKPGFWRGVGKGFQELGRGFKNFGRSVGGGSDDDED